MREISMKPLRGITVAMAFVVLTATSVAAHSLKDLENLLGEREKYFQPLDKEAPGFTLRDADGQTMRLSDFHDKVVVLHFIYARCRDVCPLHADKIAEVQAMVNQTPMRDQVQFISITTDPVNDTLEVLREYGPVHGLDGTNWVFLTTKPDQPEDTTRKLAERYGHKFMLTDDGYQVHGVVTHVIDRDGGWRANFHGLKFDPANLVVFVNALVNDVHAPSQAREQSYWEKIRSWF